jgi:hypothetical protein
MLIFLILLCALMMIFILIQFTSYSRSLRKELSADSSITKECDTISGESSGLQLR